MIGGPSHINTTALVGNAIDNTKTMATTTFNRPSLHRRRSSRTSSGPIYPTTFRWQHSGKDVFISGSFDNWASKIPLKRTTLDGDEFETTIELDRSKDILFKFIVDGVWRCGNYPTRYDAAGYVNNILEAIKI